MMSKIRHLSLVAIGLLIGLLSCELALRVAGISYPIFAQIDGDLGAALRPQAEGWWKREGEEYIRINTVGLRDREHALFKPEHVFRVAILGDSYAEALQVRMEDTFWAVMERELRRCPTLGGKEPEVINFGVSGYGTAQELIMLRRRVWAYAPDVVLLAITPTNDIRNNSRALEQDERRPYFVRSNGQLVEDRSFQEQWGFRVRHSSLGRMAAGLRDSSRTFQLINEALRRARQPNGAEQQPNAAGRGGRQQGQEPTWIQGEPGLDMAIYREPLDPTWKEAWAVTEELIRRMHEEVESRGKLFMVATVSSGPQVGPDPAARRVLEQRLGVPDLFYAERRIQAVGRNRFPVVALAPLFQAYAEERGVFLHGFPNSGLGHGHWNVAGHRLAGEAIARQLCHTLPGSRGHDTARQEGAALATFDTSGLLATN
jgi:hypothetical protein